MIFTMTMMPGSAVDMDALNAMLHSSRAYQPMEEAPLPGADIPLSDEQQAVIDAVLAGRDVIVDACIGSGKTTTIQRLCSEIKKARPRDRVLYLTYSKLLKADAQARVRDAKVQNYHGIVYPSLMRANIRCGISESIPTFNARFKELSADFPVYDVLIIDEYQDITEDYARLLENIKSKNPMMQIIMVGDMEQRVSAASRHNAQEFAHRFCTNPELLSFTVSFRMGGDMASRLARGWNKPITGGNEGQQVITMPYEMAYQELLAMADRPGDILCLGARKGAMPNILNDIERAAPDAFNKNTVYASIRETDGSVTISQRSAVFTTFDSSKGMERDTCFIFNFDEQYFDMRLRQPNVDPVVLRNVMLVAASRGKNRIIFVKPPRITGGAMKQWDDYIGFVNISRFQNLPAMKPPSYPRPFLPAEMYDFKYVETVDEAFNLLDVTRLDDGSGAVIEAPKSDGLVDLTPAVGRVQESLFFSGYDYADELSMSARSDDLQEKYEEYLEARRERAVREGRTATKWDRALALAAVDTEYDRYATQVDVPLSKETADAIVERMGTYLDPDDPFQVSVTLDGTAVSRVNRTGIMFAGTIDAIHDDVVVELKFVSELKHDHFLQLGAYLVMSGKEEGLLWNIRTDERWKVTIPDRQRFLDAVITCVTKQNYLKFEG